MRFALILSLFGSVIYGEYKAVTYSHKGGRFGDRVIDYIHAKWFAYINDLPLLYHPFPYSEELVLSKDETAFAEAIDLLEESDVYLSPYYPESSWEIKRYGWKNLEVPDYSNAQFIDILRKMIAPKRTLKCLYPPMSSVSIALHIREGGGYDPTGVSMENPSKIPPMNFYHTCLKAVLGFIRNESIYCQVFTDAKNPQSLIEILQENPEVKRRIEFHYRDDNAHTNNVIEDFFSFKNFDILIRPDSNFSIVSSLIYDFAIVCSPKDFIQDENQQWQTKEIEMKLNPSKIQKL